MDFNRRHQLPDWFLLSFASNNKHITPTVINKKNKLQTMTPPLVSFIESWMYNNKKPQCQNQRPPCVLPKPNTERQEKTSRGSVSNRVLPYQNAWNIFNILYSQPETDQCYCTKHERNFLVCHLKKKPLLNHKKTLFYTLPETITGRKCWFPSTK